jgi:uncharacterized membrane protein
MPSDPLFILAVLGANVALAEWLVRTTLLRHLGTALLVIVVTAATANLGLIPTGTEPLPLYEGILGDLALVAIFLLLLRVSLADVRRAGASMLTLFLLGSVGTIAGVLVALWVVDGAAAFGQLNAPLGGMFVATYTGGSLNFNALAVHYGVAGEGALYTGAVAVDSIMTSIWMVACIAIPRGLAALRPKRADEGQPVVVRAALDGVEDDTEAIHPLDLALLLALGTGALWASRWATGALAELGLQIPSVILLTTLALVLAQIPLVARLRGARTMGMLGVYLFLAVIGAYCDLGALARIGSLGVTLFLFASVVVTVHGLIVFGGATALHMDRDMAAVASQANIGGGTSALALARSLGRGDLVLPGILVGSVGTALGTYLGFLTAEWLL